MNNPYYAVSEYINPAKMKGTGSHIRAERLKNAQYIGPLRPANCGAIGSLSDF